MGERLRRLVLDAGIIVEYVVRRSPYRGFLEGLLRKAEGGELELYVNPVTVAEVLYVSSRIYAAAGVPDPGEEAVRFASWVYRKFNVVEMDFDLLVEAARLKNALRIALPDCFVLASAWRVGGAALFKKVEEEMRPVINELRERKALFAQEMLRKGSVFD